MGASTESKDCDPLRLALDDSSEARRAARARLSERFGITSEFIRVPKLSKMIGISGNSIYSQMRAGTFPVRHTKVGNVVLVLFDDFVDWYCSKKDPILALPPPTKTLTVEVGLDLGNAVGETTIVSDANVVTRMETSAERAARVKHEVIAAIMAQRRSR